ncbi:MAG: hypothetical protein NTU41_12795 [Chloroflexi bacterium]|nr:hypothetical protein [Chloroflexota bacterium]
MAEAFAAQGTLIVFEPSNVGQAKLFQEAVSLSHIVKYSHERLGHLRLPAYPAPLLEIETLGDAGLRYRLRDANRQTLSQWMLVPAYAVNSARDTAGAGDWCTGGIIHILGTNGSEGFNIAVEKNISLALRFGQALAALKCGYQGARGVMYALKRRHFDQEVQRIVAREQMPASRDNSSLRLGETLASICPKCFQNRGCTK